MLCFLFLLWSRERFLVKALKAKVKCDEGGKRDKMFFWPRDPLVENRTTQCRRFWANLQNLVWQQFLDIWRKWSSRRISERKGNRILGPFAWVLRGWERDLRLIGCCCWGNIGRCPCMVWLEKTYFWQLKYCLVALTRVVCPRTGRHCGCLVDAFVPPPASLSTLCTVHHSALCISLCTVHHSAFKYIFSFIFHKVSPIPYLFSTIIMLSVMVIE